MTVYKFFRMFKRTCYCIGAVCVCAYIFTCLPLPRFDVGINYYYYFEPRRRGTYLPKIMRCTYYIPSGFLVFANTQLCAPLTTKWLGAVAFLYVFIVLNKQIYRQRSWLEFIYYLQRIMFKEGNDFLNKHRRSVVLLKSC